MPHLLSQISRFSPTLSHVTPVKPAEGGYNPVEGMEGRIGNENLIDHTVVAKAQ